MKQRVYSIYDTKAAAFNIPFFAQNDAIAQRQFTRVSQDENSQIHSFPSDFTLFALADFDDVNGKIIPLDKPENLGMASAFLVKESEK